MMKHAHTFEVTTIEHGLRRSRRTHRASRRSNRSKVTIDILDEQGTATNIESFDLSAVGVYLHAHLPVHRGEKVRLRMRVEGHPRPMNVMGEVIRVEMGAGGVVPGIGIAFRKIDRSEQEIVRRFLLRRFLGDGR